MVPMLFADQESGWTAFSGGSESEIAPAVRRPGIDSFLISRGLVTLFIHLDLAIRVPNQFLDAHAVSVMRTKLKTLW